MLLVIACCGASWALYDRELMRKQLAAERNRNMVLTISNTDAVAAVRRCEARLSAILQQLPIGIVQTDHDGRIEMANEQAARLFGRPLGQLPGTTLDEIAHIADRAHLRMFFEGMSDGSPTPEIRLRASVAGRPALLVHAGLAGNSGPDSLLLAVECMAA
ncbi:PAS domain-containing protein [Sandarakinorhabdus sp. DWP1-3-1]|uniref:PAS domain-containing protein n=1 Tax=Sandarakinorhabdus sp. DWP1-3-1 TaxID=2804627 RepID=UPI003CFB4C71